MEGAFGSEVRETANEDGAIRITNDLGITVGVICKRVELNVLKVEKSKIMGRKTRKKKSTDRGRRRSREEHGRRRCREGGYRCRQCFRLELDDMSLRRTRSLCCGCSFFSHSLSLKPSIDYQNVLCHIELLFNNIDEYLNLKAQSIYITPNYILQLIIE